MPYRDRKAKQAWDRTYQQRRRARNRVRLIYDVVPDLVVPKPLVRQLRAMGIEPESLTWEKLRDLWLGREPGAMSYRRTQARDMHHAWLLFRIRSLEQENARLLDTLDQLGRHATASRRILSEQQAPYGVKRNRTPQATVPLRNEEAGREA